MHVVRRRHTNRWTACALVSIAALLAPALGGCSEPTAVPEGQPSPTETAPDLSGADLWLSFDEHEVGPGGVTTYADALGRPFVARVVTAHDGDVQRAPGAGDSAGSVAFPSKCTASSGCPRAMVEVPTGPELDPADDDFEYGAAVWLAPEQTTTGSNIVQQGRFATDGGQWKLQVDNDAGEPSCVVRSGSDVLVVRSRVSVADSAWHHVWCRRDEQGVSIRVDGIEDRKDGRTGSVSNAWPVRIGSPGVGDHDDQFHGRIDDVFLRIER